MDTLIRSLHPLEVRVLLHLADGGTIGTAELESKLGYKTGQANQVVSWLSGKGALEEISRTTSIFYELTELGAAVAENGSVEERIVAHLEKHGPADLPALAKALSLEGREVGSAFGKLGKAAVCVLNENKQVALTGKTLPAELLAVRRLALAAKTRGGVLAETETLGSDKPVIEANAKKRGAGDVVFRIAERDTVVFKATALASSLRKELEAAGITGEESGALTPAMLKDGSWKTKTFRSWNIDVPPARLALGRRNAYCEFLDHVKDRLVGFGFEEFDGPLVETEFWNCDALFMPQFHAARDIHDVYYVKNPDPKDPGQPAGAAKGFTYAKSVEQPWLDHIAATHQDGGGTGSRGWGYNFDRDFTRRLILRSQGTVMSAKTLPRATVPGKYFGIMRCFRYDQVDATHLSDFYQTEGIVLGNEVNLRNLLGLLKMFATELAGATEVKYVPGYFPFTEPSVEVHIKHPVLGWFELGGAGIFRAEVTRPLGIEVPVLAWGLGIDRMALMHLGLNDLRELFSSDIESVRLRKRSL